MTDRFVYEQIGKGYILGIRKDSNGGILTPGFGHYGEISFLVSEELIKVVINNLYKLTELGEPPIGKRSNKPGSSWRSGWRELGLSNMFDWYCHIQ